MANVYYIVFGNGEPYIEERLPFPGDEQRTNKHTITIKDVDFYGPFRSMVDAQNTLDELE